MALLDMAIRCVFQIVGVITTPKLVQMVNQLFALVVNSVMGWHVLKMLNPSHTRFGGNPIHCRLKHGTF